MISRSRDEKMTFQAHSMVWAKADKVINIRVMWKLKFLLAREKMAEIQDFKTVTLRISQQSLDFQVPEKWMNKASVFRHTHSRGMRGRLDIWKTEDKKQTGSSNWRVRRAGFGSCCRRRLIGCLILRVSGRLADVSSVGDRKHGNSWYGKHRWMGGWEATKMNSTSDPFESEIVWTLLCRELQMQMQNSGDKGL